MAKHTLIILQCSYSNLLKYVWSFFHITHEEVQEKEPGILLLFKKVDISITSIRQSPAFQDIFIMSYLNFACTNIKW